MTDGSKVYNGKPCKKFGHTLRYINGNMCLECNRANGKLHDKIRDGTIERRAAKALSSRKHAPKYKLQKCLRTRLYIAIKNGQKAGSAVADLGCTIPELRAYLESKFQHGMTWENWSIHGWHIDHIRPLVSFNLNDRAQFLQACHFSNLQPLWAKDNLRKWSKE